MQHMYSNIYAKHHLTQYSSTKNLFNYFNLNTFIRILDRVQIRYIILQLLYCLSDAKKLLFFALLRLGHLRDTAVRIIVTKIGNRDTRLRDAFIAATLRYIKRDVYRFAARTVWRAVPESRNCFPRRANRGPDYFRKSRVGNRGKTRGREGKLVFPRV